MSKSSDLFELIKSFTQTEKSYFKKYSQYHNPKASSLYNELFNLIDAQEQYDEDSIVEKLSNKIFAKNISAGKNHLYNLLLKSLRNYHASKSARIQIRELYINTLILSDRRLNKQALKLLSKAKKIAKRYDLKHELAEIILFQRTITRTFAEKKTGELIQNYQTEYKQNTKSLKQEEGLLMLYENIFLIEQGKSVEKDEMESLFKDFQTKFSFEELSYEGRSITCFMNAFYYMQKRNYEEVARQFEYLVNFFEEKPYLQKEYILRYMNLLNNSIVNYLRMETFEKIYEVIVKFEKITTGNSQMKVVQLHCLYYAKIVYLLATKQYKEAVGLAPEVWIFLKNFKRHIPKNRRESLYVNFATAFFYNGGFNESLKWLEFLLYEFEAKLRPDIGIFARNLQILNHFELDNDPFVEYQIIRMKSRYKNSKYKNMVFPILQALKKIINAPRSEEKYILKDLYENIKDNPKMRDMTEWLEVRKTWKK